MAERRDAKNKSVGCAISEYQRSSGSFQKAAGDSQTCPAQSRGCAGAFAPRLPQAAILPLLKISRT